MNILIVEDDESVTSTIRFMLEAAQLKVAEVTDSGEDAVELLAIYNYDIILIGDHLTDMSPPEFIAAVRRKAQQKTPIIALSAIRDSEYAARLLNAGADDYVRMPTAGDELVARCRAVGRRAAGLAENLVKIGPITINLTDRELLAHGKKVRLTKAEMTLMISLASRPGRTRTKESILADLAGHDPDHGPEIKIVDVYICKIRSKLRAFGVAGHLETVWGSGYRLSEDDTSNPASSADRLVEQRRKVLALLEDGVGRTLKEISDAVEGRLTDHALKPLLSHGWITKDMTVHDPIGGQRRVITITDAGRAAHANQAQAA